MGHAAREMRTMKVLAVKMFTKNGTKKKDDWSVHETKKKTTREV